MSKCSIVVDKKVLDFRYKKLTDFSYAFYVGDILVGQVFKMKRYWSCVSHEPHELCPVDGFKLRHYAAEFLIKLNGYYNRRDR